LARKSCSDKNPQEQSTPMLQQPNVIGRRIEPPAQSFPGKWLPQQHDPENFV